jgi:hypothetical protein
MAEEVKVECPVCGNPVGTKENGTLIKAHSVSGSKCDGSSAEVQSADTAPEGLGKGDPFDALEGAQGASDETDDENDPETLAEPETGAQGVASSEVPTFVHIVTVSHSCPYLADSAWHHENVKMAAKAAQQAGHVLAGSEAQYAGAVPQGEFLLVHYNVPVK